MSHATDTSSSQVWTTIRPGETKSSGKLLRQYYKTHAHKIWSYHSKSFYDLGFFPVNPLHVDEHRLVNSKDASIICHSAVYRIFAVRDFPEDLNMERLLELFKECKSVAKKYGDKLDNIVSFAAMKEVVRDDTGRKLLAATLADIENAANNLFKDDRKTKAKTKKLLLELGNIGFFTCLLNKNKRFIKATQKLFLK